jgi:aspartokinase
MAIINNQSYNKRKCLISGILQKLNLNGFMVSFVSGGADVGRVFQTLAFNKINIEFTNQIINMNGHNSAVLCVDRKDSDSTSVLLEELKTDIKACEIFPLNKVGILSIFPHREHALIEGIIIQTLFSEKISVYAMASSISVVSCVIKEERTSEGIRLLSREFGLT